MSCTLEMPKRAWPDRKKYSLQAISSYMAEDGIVVQRSIEELELTRLVYLALVRKLDRFQ